jgi:site-specific recombinase XerC
VAIDRDDVDLKNRWARIRGKGKRWRQVPFGEKAAEAVIEYLPERKKAIAEDEPALFVNVLRGKRLTTRSLQLIVKQWALAALGDVALHPHTLRHACATHLLQNGVEIRAVQKLLGHASLSSTQRYTHLSLKDVISAYDKARPKA